MASPTQSIDIPIVDLRPENKHAPTELLQAATQFGFVYIENDGTLVSPKDNDNIFSLSKQFFAAPLEVKEAVSIASNAAGKNHGWLSRGIEMLDPATQKRADVKEALNIGDHYNGQLQQPMPETLQDHVKSIVDFQDACHALCQRIFEQLAIALSIDRDWFTSRHDKRKGPSGTLLRLLYYPKVDDVEDGVDIRAGAHSDFGSITLLFQRPGEPGLEIKTPEGQWAGVPVNPRGDGDGTALPILVNIGDLLEDWTGGLLRSTVHRVVFPKGEDGSDRYSIAYFCHPLDDATLDPVPSTIVQEHTAKTGRGSSRNGKVLTAKDHLMERLAATYHLK